MIQNGQRALERAVHGKDVADNRGGRAALVGKPCHPFHDRVVKILRALDPKIESGRGVIAFEYRLNDVGVNPASG